MKLFHIRKAFSMLELVFVIVILGIVSSIGAEVIAKVYESYHIQRASYRSSIKIGLASTQIANRLIYAIPSTIVGRISNNDATYQTAEGMEVNSTLNYEVLQWIAYDSDSFAATGWSGFADLRHGIVNQTTIQSTGSNLGLTNTIISNLSGGTKNISNAVLLFPNEFDSTVVGYNGNSNGLNAVSSGTGEKFTVADMVGKTIKEHYKLAWSSYAIVPMPPISSQGIRDGLHDLYLRYNLQPWIGGGTDYQDETANHSQLLLQNVSLFQFTASATTIRFKICQREYITDEFFINTCKEKAVIR